MITNLTDTADQGTGAANGRRSKASSIRRRLAGVAVVLAAATAPIAAISLEATPAGAAGSSVMVQTFTPRSTPSSQGPQYWTVKAGTSVTMQCWTTGPYTNGTGKWFRIRSNSYPFTQGYVPATTVGNQTIVGHC